ncbi:hypothetical protein RFI_08942 [Reticulomyxa filosa]|uniref:Uncharacterized protein n=1 Tax=Reticulomyxa filosa TaxID=46433 RepID=X6NQ92_RETFI|nr:hypothetical protein RFI_08942 [Reticulomyxa filosa]|eukprot:ETO28191.1 hypothetical protein RFI_08942 [Reticulomyxa filosa]
MSEEVKEAEKKAQFQQELELLYYGSIPTYLKRQPGTFVSFDSKRCQVGDTDEEIKVAAMRRFPQFALGEEYSRILVPAMPCVDVKLTKVKEEKDKESETETHKTKAPKQDLNAKDELKWVGNPLLKCKKHENENIKCELVHTFASGVRSAIVEFRNEEVRVFYRLKGCGNNEDGFLYRCIQDNTLPFMEIRGSSFLHTSVRELYMNDLIQRILKDNAYKIPFRCANIRSVGYYEYEEGEEEDDIKLSKIKKCCSVFETIGNRRLGDDLIIGLECLYDRIIDWDNVHKDDYMSKNSTIIDSSRINESDGILMETYMAVLCGCPLIQKKVAIPLKHNIQDRFTKNNLETHCAGEYDKIMKSILESKDKNTQVSGTSNEILCDIMYRLGFESGMIQRILFENKISWGTYQDAFGYHCNAHCNNYVVTIANAEPANTSPICWLSPLDFDMAFLENEYLPYHHPNWSEWMEKHVIGESEYLKAKRKKWIKIFDNQQVEHSFKDIITLEINGNRLSLAGDPQISTGVQNTVPSNHSSPKHDFVKWVLRDMLVKGFNDSLDMTPSQIQHVWFENFMKWSPYKINIASNLFNLALIQRNGVVV